MNYQYLYRKKDDVCILLKGNFLLQLYVLGSWEKQGFNSIKIKNWSAARQNSVLQVATPAATEPPARIMRFNFNKIKKTMAAGDLQT